MKVLVTGAGGFLGQHVVAALRQGGHEVRAVVRPRASTSEFEHDSGIEIIRADLRVHPDLCPAFVGADALVHLAATMAGSEFSRFSEIVTTTERVLEAMARSDMRRLVLCSSFSVYDWQSAHGTVDERLPLARNVYECGGYAAGKLWQERLAERAAKAHGWDLTILRPGYIWGRGNECPESAVGRSLGRLQFVFGPHRCPPLTYVKNCAEAFRSALERAEAIGATVNVVDEEAITAWRFSGEHSRRSMPPWVRIPLPLALLAPMVRLAASIGRALLGPRARLPSLILPAHFAQECRSLRYDPSLRREVLGMITVPISFERALEETYRTWESRVTDSPAPMRTGDPVQQ